MTQSPQKNENSFSAVRLYPLPAEKFDEKNNDDDVDFAFVINVGGWN
jgi:hypothetical protein